MMRTLLNCVFLIATALTFAQDRFTSNKSTREPHSVEEIPVEPGIDIGVDIGCSPTVISGDFIDSKPEAKIVIRCAPSIKPDQDPLIVINGVIATKTDVRNLDPEDISFIDAITGEKASAVFGCRAINGVIVITLKKVEDVIDNKETESAPIPIEVYPNPTTGSVHVTGDLNDYQLLDYRGNVIHASRSLDNTQVSRTISDHLSNSGPGLYFLRSGEQIVRIVRK